VLAVTTHYVQTFELAASRYYENEAVKYLRDAGIWKGLDNIKWDVPFPPVCNPKFTFIDLFAGIGGIRIAFQNLGGKCVFSSEQDKHAKQSYETNFGEVQFGDITKIGEERIPEHDILLAGFPC